LQVTLYVDIRPSASYWDAAAGDAAVPVLVDKSLASIEAEDRWEERVPADERRLSGFGDIRPVVFRSRSLLPADE